MGEFSSVYQAKFIIAIVLGAIILGGNAFIIGKKIKTKTDYNKCNTVYLDGEIIEKNSVDPLEYDISFSDDGNICYLKTN